MFATGGKFLKKAASKVDDVGGLVASKSDDLAEEVVRLCFPEGVLVDTESGHKRIETVEAGERVWAYDVVTSEWRLCRVLQTFERDYEGDSVFVTVDGETIESTFRHPYWVVEGKGLDDRPLLDHHAAIPENATTPGRWIDAGDLQTADILLLRDGRQVPVTSISTKPVAQKVYNFEVEGLHNYAVGKSGILVHNNNGDEALASIESVASSAAEGFDNLQCVECAEAVKKALASRGHHGEVIELVSRDVNPRRGFIWSDAAGKNIGQGKHAGVRAGGKVYDNLNPQGMDPAAWLNDLHSPGGLIENITPF